MNTYILSAKRTPIGSFMGALSKIPATALGSKTIATLLNKDNKNNYVIPLQDIQECFMGHVLTTGVGQAPARQSALGAGLKNSVQCMTINKVCGSGLKAIMLAQDSISLGRSHVVIAGGQENMSLSPYIISKARSGLRLGDKTLQDTIIKDGLWDPYHNFHMGNAGEICAKEYNITREQQDEFAINSYKKTHKAQQEGWFKNELITLNEIIGKKSFLIDEDEEPRKVIFNKIPNLKPAFEKSGTITAANASKINDGAAALLLVSEDYKNTYKLKPIARIIAQGTFAQAPQYFTTAPVQSIKNCLQNANMKLSDIDLFEINEAFSVVTLAVCKQLEIPSHKLNIHGGAVALGHPIGASGARIITTLIHALRLHNKKYGMASICLGGGEAVSMLVEAIK